MIPEYKPYAKTQAAWDRVMLSTGTKSIQAALRVLVKRKMSEATICHNYNISRWSVRSAAQHYGLSLPGNRTSPKE